jgi:hypothetical protein
MLGNGVTVWGSNTNNGSTGGLAFITISNSNISNNGNDGIYVYTTNTLDGLINPANAQINVFNVVSDYNTNGYEASGVSIMRLTRSEALFDTQYSVVIDNGADGLSTQDNVLNDMFGVRGTLHAYAHY